MVINKEESNRERVTSQREAILNYLKETESHPTAKEVHEAVKEKLSRISLGTVYRNLNELVEEGQIQKLSGEEDRYDSNCDFHAHFICEKCGEVYDVDLDREELKQQVEVGRVKDTELYFYGVCNKCKN